MNETKTFYIHYEYLHQLITLLLEKFMKCTCDPSRSLIGSEESGHYWQCEINLEALRIVYEQ
jgi:hypothetical protein